MAHQVKEKQHRRGEVIFGVGKSIEPTEDELKAFPDRFEEVAPRRGRPPRSESAASEETEG